MRGNLPTKEVDYQKEWEEADVYGQRQKRMKETNIRASRWPTICQWCGSHGTCLKQDFEGLYRS